MDATIENDGEIREATVNASGSVYLGDKWTGKKLRIAFEVVDDD